MAPLLERLRPLAPEDGPLALPEGSAPAAEVGDCEVAQQGVSEQPLEERVGPDHPRLRLAADLIHGPGDPAEAETPEHRARDGAAPEAQAARAYGRPKGYETYQIFGSAGGDVFFTYAFVAKDLKRLFVVKPDALGAKGLAMPSEGLRIPSNAIGSSIIRLSRCSEPPVATVAVFKKPISVGAGTDATKLPTVRVVRDVNYRTGPDDSYRKVGTFKRGQVLKFTNFDGNWYEFNIGGRKVYSYRRFFAN